jgi:hypothetical protein
MPENVSQVRYTDAEVEQIKSIFPDVDSLKLYRKYLLDVPLTHDEIDRVQALWAPASVRAIIYKTTLPLIDGNETIATGYDLLNSVSVNEPNFDISKRRIAMFVHAIKYLNSRIEDLNNLPESATGKGKWLTASVLGGGWNDETGNRFVDEENTTNILNQLCIKANVEGILVGLNALISAPVETEEEKAKRLLADSAN